MYKQKRNTDSRLVKWLRHEGFTPVLNPIFKSYLKIMFLKRTYKYYWLFISAEATFFRRYYEGTGWVFVMMFARACDAPPAVHVFTSNVRTPAFGDGAFAEAEVFEYHYLTGVKQYVRGQGEKRRHYGTRTMTLRDWFKSKKEVI